MKTAGGHSSLNIETEMNGQSRNMADVGLGYSQIAPVAIQLWAASQRITNRSMFNRIRSASGQILRDAGSIVVVEQPELHLHPAYQAKLADVFASCIQNPALSDMPTQRRANLRILAETHSPNLINRIGEIIMEGGLSSNDVQVLVFEPDSEQAAATNIRIATFNDKGILQNWPIGFFDY